MRLEPLLKGMTILDFQGDPEQEIGGLAYDSHAVRPGFLFVAMRGHSRDGHVFIKDAVKNGAVALVAEEFEGINTSVARVLVSDSRDALSKLAVNFYNRPFDGVDLIGITGTNGKTTTSYLLESIIRAAGAKPGVIGTINYRLPGHTWEARVTTPESLDLMHTLRRMADGGVTHVVMEVSSHALDQGRARECPFRVAVFTNLTRDHLDYHESMEAYFEAKSMLFRGPGETGSGNRTTAVINADDPRGKALARLTDFPVVTYGLGKDCDIKADQVKVTKAGLTATLICPAGETGIRSSLIGDFNIYNILAATTAALCMDIDLDAVASGIADLKGVPGRLELVENVRSLAVVVDYAHTPDALAKASSALKPIVTGRLITVFGCGGDRDKGKRGEMGLVAGQNSDIALVTSDNPRTEDPESIISQIEAGVRESGLKKLAGSQAGEPGVSGYILEPDRRNAIRRAVEMAGRSDLILIAGKGHEDYQIIGNERIHFDDRDVVVEVIRDLGAE